QDIFTQRTAAQWIFSLFLTIQVSSDNDLDWNFCGTWHHGNNPLSLNLNISTGCKGISISANESFLSINGQITAQCRRSEVITFKHLGYESGGDINEAGFAYIVKTHSSYMCCLFQAIAGRPVKSNITVHLPAALKQAAKNVNNVACTFFKNISLLQEAHKTAKPINDVVEITVENEIIRNLPEPIRIDFYHEAVSVSLACVSWDTRKGWNHLEMKIMPCCSLHCFLWQDLNRQPVPHLLELTVITYLGCAISLISCVALIIYLCRKRRRSKEQSLPIHVGLAVSLAFLSLIFFFNGVLANVGGESVCTWVGAVLHYALLCSFAWMGIEVLHTFWLVYMVFTPRLKPYIWNLVGFALPAVPVVILAPIGDIYGLIEVPPSEDPENPYKMCWMDITENKGWLAFCLTNMMTLALLVSSGLVMLFLVYRQIRTRDEWKQNRVAFLSIWGLSCLYGTTWGLAFLKFEPISTFILFITCILNSFQGFFLMLRFCMLDWMQKQAGGSGLGSSSTGSTRQHMLQAQEKS
uniref:G-protein coupled receptor 126-like n=1 Tax=Pundamilia nyererei TaxID=303518 RepID=A0A3B4GIW9_9CICH